MFCCVLYYGAYLIFCKVHSIFSYDGTESQDNHSKQFNIENERFCIQSKPKILIYIFSAVHNFYHRRVIRKTWGNRTVLNETAEVVFIVGRSSNISIETAVQNENSQFNDIVQGNFLDSYYNLTYKSITAFKWLHQHCKGAKIIIKVDDDIVLNVKRVIEAVSPYQKAHRHFMCYLYDHSFVVRDQKSKFSTSVKEMSSKFYPPYCNGWVYIYTADIVEEMCEALEKTEKFKNRGHLDHRICVEKAAKYN